MASSHFNLSPSQAAARLGITIKALRYYEDQGLIEPDRASKGWRLYSVETMQRAREIVSLRKLGLSIEQIKRVIGGELSDVTVGLEAQEKRLVAQIQEATAMLKRLRALQADARSGDTQIRLDFEPALSGSPELSVGFALPWPWAGEWFELNRIPSINFITGPLGSGKTRFARQLAIELADTIFLAPDRKVPSEPSKNLAEQSEVAASLAREMNRLEEEGATPSAALEALVAAFVATQSHNLVVDMVEDGLDDQTQVALMMWLRLKPRFNKAVFLMTRSSSILDLELMDPLEEIILCPANHSPPIKVAHLPGGFGYESLVTCLATPAARARTAGIVAVRSSKVA
jgi:DNA-binding transcriptional MerR regulator